MGDTAAFYSGWPNLNRANPSPLGGPRLNDRAVPRILRGCGHRPRRRLDHYVGRTKLPGKRPQVLVRPLTLTRQIVWVSKRCAGIDPTQDRVNLRVAERTVVLEMLNADRLVDVPRRHLPRCDATPDRLRPRANFLVGEERHRRDRIGPMA